MSFSSVSAFLLAAELGHASTWCCVGWGRPERGRGPTTLFRVSLAKQPTLMVGLHLSPLREFTSLTPPFGLPLRRPTSITAEQPAGMRTTLRICQIWEHTHCQRLKASRNLRFTEEIIEIASKIVSYISTSDWI